MKVEPRNRGYGLTDILVIAENKQDSELLNQLGKRGTKVCGEIRLSDVCGEHYVLIHPEEK